MTPSVLTTCQMVSDAKSYCLIFLTLPQWMYQRFLTGSKKEKNAKTGVLERNDSLKKV